ncbi:uncharacterized protein EKO05_0009117 [Ascochyta rabiei]|nr:uncharacterized protein EKO05_0009117 [Ascochyta rabiei]UPX18829.1 hypothetical protein EKO05_0009117 [Ascochyta rabiei]
MPFGPTVLHPLTLPALLDYLLSTQAAAFSPTTLVVCSDQPAFLDDLARSSAHQQAPTDQDGSLQQLLTPTLHNLSATQHVKLAFCPSVQALLAYLTAYDRPAHVHAEESAGRDRLVLVNPLALHKSTPSFSAQGLSRTFAAAVEAALRTGAMLLLVECERRRDGRADRVAEDAPVPGGEEENPAAAEQQPPWDQDVSLLNLSARRFGSGAGERAWTGRTVKAKSIAARWFHFQHLAGRTKEEPE